MSQRTTEKLAQKQNAVPYMATNQWTTLFSGLLPQVLYYSSINGGVN